MSLISLEVIEKLWPHGDDRVKGLRAAIAGGDEWLQKVGVDAPLTVAHLMAQVSHECGAGLEMVENLNYRAEALYKQWPSHFTWAQAQEMAHNQQAIANQAYNGRMGNRVGTDDGWNYRGRGGTQTTGREAYAKLAEKTGLDLLNHPEYLNDPLYFMQVVCLDFEMCGCVEPAKHDDVNTVTHRLNGGYIGLDQRKIWLARWKQALGA